MQYYPAQNPYMTNPYMQQAIVPPAMQQMQQQQQTGVVRVSASLGRPVCVRGTCIGG